MKIAFEIDPGFLQANAPVIDRDSKSFEREDGYFLNGVYSRVRFLNYRRLGLECLGREGVPLRQMIYGDKNDLNTAQIRINQRVRQIVSKENPFSLKNGPFNERIQKFIRIS